MHHEGDLTVLKQLRNGSYAPWLVICPGTMRGVYGGGQVTALEARNLTNGFAGVVGVSTGAPTAAYFLAGQAALGTSIYYEECTTRHFISVRRAFTGGHAIDVGYLAKLFRSGSKKLDESRIHTNDTELRLGVTRYDTACEAYVDAKRIEPDIVEGIHASIALPALYRDEVFIGGERYNDGFSCRPIRYALSRKPSGILVLANAPPPSRASLVGRICTDIVMRAESKAQRMAMRGQRDAWVEDIESLRCGTVPYLIVWSDAEVGSFTRNPVTLKSAAFRAKEHMLFLLDRAGV